MGLPVNCRRYVAFYGDGWRVAARPGVHCIGCGICCNIWWCSRRRFGDHLWRATRPGPHFAHEAMFALMRLQVVIAGWDHGYLPS